MKTKNIFKALALAMLMPAMLLTTACSNDDDAVNNVETITKKGYELPVTVNVTRQGDDPVTRATYNGSTRKLSFGTGDKLFVTGSYSGGGYPRLFAGTLTWVSEGTFSGTITTETEWTGTVDALFTAGSANATLLPAGYEEYHYLYIDQQAGYDDCLMEYPLFSFALTKAAAVEQLSCEMGNYVSGTGFVLAPRNAILNFTITGLTASTGYDVAVGTGVVVSPTEIEMIIIPGHVTANGSGTATFAVGVSGGTESDNITLTVGVTPITLNLFSGTSTTLAAGHIYNITRSAAPSLPAGAIDGKFTINGSGTQVYFSQGNLQATTTDGSTWAWAFATNQWDYIGSAAGNTSVDGNGTVSGSGTRTVDLFGWSTSATTLGINNSTDNIYTGDFADWGSNSTVQAGIGTGWRTLTSAEWTYLLNTRSITNRYCKATVNSKTGMVIFPDSYTHPSGPDAIASANTTGAAFTTNTWSADDWAKMETAGAVFLPAAGFRLGAPSVYYVGSNGYYWSSTPYEADHARYLYFDASDVSPATGNYRCLGYSVRLVRDAN